ncbi:4-alpha-glucanotransferase [Desulfoplanes sp. PS50]
MTRRASGILLHITSLPSRYGIGDLGPEAYNFVDFLASAKQTYWQLLPLTPTNSGTGNSPYNAYSAFAGNPLLISPDLLLAQRFLSSENLREVPCFPDDRVEYARVAMWKDRLLTIAFENGLSWLPGRSGYQDFKTNNQGWLEDYALFASLKQHFEGLPWYYWPKDIRFRHPSSLDTWRNRLNLQMERERFKQFVFFEQLGNLKGYCATKGVRLFGDMPIYVSLDSCDVWSHPELFDLDANRLPIHVAGAPPDYFSKKGQLWGNPVYDWERMEDNGFAWWTDRLGHNQKLYDTVRLDHFRGFAAFWQVPACSRTARNGVWRPCPGKRLFEKVLSELPDLDIIAEDLGHITDDVRELMDHFGFSGMKVLQFAFSDDLPNSPYIPHNVDKHSVFYTGTHDNNTLQGWYENDISLEERELAAEYLGTGHDFHGLHWAMIRAVMMSVAHVCVFPLQDVLELGGEARMNRPSETDGNWAWRVRRERLSEAVARKLARMVWLYGRDAAANDQGKDQEDVLADTSGRV